MTALPLLAIDLPTEALQGLGEQAGSTAGKAAETAMQFAGDPTILLGGIGLVIAAVMIFLFLKKIVVNTILGVIGWAIVLFVLKIELPLIPSLAVSVIFGLAGIGAMLVLRFFGMI
jgi:hypothetical protein